MTPTGRLSSASLLLLLLAACDRGSLPAGDSSAPLEEAGFAIGQPQLRAEAGGFVADFEALGLRATLHDGVVETVGAQGALRTRLVALNGAALPAGEALALRGSRVEQALQPGLLAWWKAGAEGLEQGWTLDAAPASPDLALTLAVEGAAQMVSSAPGLIELTAADGARWYYRGLAAHDATGKALPAWMEVEGQQIVVRVDLRGAAYPVEIDPFTTTAAATKSGSASSQLGWASASAGDLDGDGYDDVVVAAYGGNAVYLHRGSASGLDTTATQTLTGSSNFGYRLATGDWNGDGMGDLAVFSQGGNGSVRIFDGVAGGTYNSTASVTLSRSGSTNFGWSLARADINSDGIDDLIVGERGSSSTGSTAYGRVMTYLGSASGLSSTASQTLSIGTMGGPYFGNSLAVGDLNGDDVDDLIVGASQAGTSNAGGAYIYYGTGSGFPSTADTSYIHGTSSVYVGMAVAIGDVNGDGVDDAILGSEGTTATASVMLVFYGSATGINTATIDQTFSPGVSAAYYFGATLTVGDANGDDIADVFVSARGSSVKAGVAYLYEGSASGLALASTITGAISTGFGRSLAMGDWNGDRLDDGLIGANTVSSSAGAWSSYHAICTDADSDTICAPFDCDDSSASVGAATLGFIDGDGDGFGSSLTDTYCPGDTGFAPVDGDCDDENAAANPDGVEICDSDDVDEDCSGSADNADAGASPATKSTFYVDADGDSYGSTTTATFCDLPASGYATTHTDCDDSAASINPGAAEVCDAGNTDEDCDGSSDDADSSATGKTTWYVDSDGDTYGGSSTTQACDASTGVVAVGGDCNDSASAINPGATEVCDPADVDEDCDGSADDASASGTSTYYVDADGDTFGTSVTAAFCDLPASGYATVSGDCDDSTSAIKPGGTEVCDAANADEDCDGSADNADTSATTASKSTYYLDSDADGYGGTTSGLYCDLPSGYSTVNTDCDDTTAVRSPGNSEVCDAGNIDEDCDSTADNNDSSALVATKGTFYLDSDADGYGGTTSAKYCDLPTGYSAVNTDCDDTTAVRSPGNTEVCDAGNIDEDCDSAADNNDSSALAATKSTFYVDADGDSYGSTTTGAFCDLPSGYSLVSTDCDDTTSVRSPGNTEVCDASNIDEDCDSAADNNDSSALVSTKGTYYLDSDADGYGSTTSALYCDLPTGYSAVSTDCDDTTAVRSPGNTEVCDAGNIDEDCDSAADNNDSSALAATKTTYYVDADGDSYGSTTTGAYCDLPSGYAAVSGDCNDSSSTISPAGTEICDAANTDEDCDGTADNADSSASGTKTTYYVDADSDGYGSSTTGSYCDLPSGYASITGDCDDSAPAINPGATEVCDAANTDEDCDGSADNNDSSASTATKSTYYLDSDSDGYGGTTSGKYCDLPTGYSTLSTDCNDAAIAINPGATEVCDAANVDEDCDTLADNADSSASTATKSTYYLDSDSDGYGSTTTGAYCDLPSGYATDATDCDDTRASVSPGGTEVCDASNLDEDCDGAADNSDSSALATTKSTYYQDSDGDGYGSTVTGAYCDLPSGFSTNSSDCNDASATISPAGSEVCDAANVDEDCDGLSDNSDSSASTATKSTYYLDSDGDGYGSTTTGKYCDLPSGYSTLATDCDDSRATISPAGTEVCDASNLDEDCDSLSDDADSSVSAATKATWYRDADGDTYGTSSTTQAACDKPTGYVSSATDCNDLAAAINPAASEVCDAANVDEDCDLASDDADSSVLASTKSTWYTDSDGDGYGVTTSTLAACDQPSGRVALPGDCNDASTAYNPAASDVCSDPADYNCDGSVGYADADADGFAACEECDDNDGAISPSGIELCDLVDNNCDGTVDEASAADAPTWYFDSDGDGYGDAALSSVACTAPLGYVASDADCDDADVAYNPAAPEACDDPNDYNCDGLVEYADVDGDGYAACTECDDTDASVSPAGVELCDGVDNNCDGVVDEPTAVDAATWYVDSDFDNYGNPAISEVACEAPLGYVADNTDCNDADSAFFPGAAEECTEEVDYNCDGSTGYADADGDGWAACLECDDTNAAVNPDKEEVCDDLDNDCDGTVDVNASDAVTWYIDQDDDGHGVDSETTTACTQPEGYAGEADDCDDTRATVSPEAAEVCDDSLDNNCDDLVDAEDEQACPAEDTDDTSVATDDTADEDVNDNKGGGGKGGCASLGEGQGEAGLLLGALALLAVGRRRRQQG